MTPSFARRAVASLMAASLLALAGQAAAHAHLLSSDPAAGATVGLIKRVDLSFSEALEPKFSAATITAADGKAVNGGTVATGKELVIAAPVALTPGAYKVSWHVVSRDGHASKGEFAFTVR